MSWADMSAESDSDENVVETDPIRGEIAKNLSIIQECFGKLAGILDTIASTDAKKPTTNQTLVQSKNQLDYAKNMRDVCDEFTGKISSFELGMEERSEKRALELEEMLGIIRESKASKVSKVPKVPKVSETKISDKTFAETIRRNTGTDLPPPVKIDGIMVSRTVVNQPLQIVAFPDNHIMLMYNGRPYTISGAVVARGNSRYNKRQVRCTYHMRSANCTIRNCNRYHDPAIRQCPAEEHEFARDYIAFLLDGTYTNLTVNESMARDMMQLGWALMWKGLKSI